MMNTDPAEKTADRRIPGPPRIVPWLLMLLLLVSGVGLKMAGVWPFKKSLPQIPVEIKARPDSSGKGHYILQATNVGREKIDSVGIIVSMEGSGIRIFRKTSWEPDETIEICGQERWIFEGLSEAEVSCTGYEPRSYKF